MYWIIPCKKKYYDVDGAFANLERVDWRQKGRMEVGDIVYIYCGEPDFCLAYKCIATAVNKPEVTYNDSVYCSTSDPLKKAKQYVELKMLKKLQGEQYSLKALKENGLTTTQFQIHVPEQLNYYLKAQEAEK